MARQEDIEIAVFIANLISGYTSTSLGFRKTLFKGRWGIKSLNSVTELLARSDGKKIAFIGNDDPFQGYQVTHLYVMNVDGSGVKNLTADLDRDAGNPQWEGSGQGIYFEPMNFSPLIHDSDIPQNSPKTSLRKPGHSILDLFPWRNRLGHGWNPFGTPSE
jgi:dipeptidyl aminopeptidase/acylaminoacyl peptidase